MKKFILGTLVAALSFGVVIHDAEAKRSSPRRHTVSGYTRRDGTYVRPHTRGSGSSFRPRSSSRRYRSRYSSDDYSSPATLPDSGSDLAPSGTFADSGAGSLYDSSGPSESVAGSFESSDTLPDTGGAPLLLSLVGSSIALGGLALRRRL